MAYRSWYRQEQESLSGGRAKPPGESRGTSSLDFRPLLRADTSIARHCYEFATCLESAEKNNALALLIDH
ncbi:hypothetical protein GQ602_000557 [Ophiocordyceps camponoti-floridani]|uniref:Uncharacterized protein n=1 Tax=Ophiocordyceps camponoti-floridani TaxID=2030778 RepID=A0A8H4VGD1_9HYPO|nr:hypothetical protein GQ602_000557 [Ophiocordyceps camponoti-floridani]